MLRESHTFDRIGTSSTSNPFAKPVGDAEVPLVDGRHQPAATPDGARDDLISGGRRPGDPGFGDSVGCPVILRAPGILMAVGVLRRGRGQVAIGAVALLVSVFVAASWMDTLRVELEFESPSFKPGEPVHFALNVCSNSVLPMRTDDGKASWRITNDAGDVVADSSHQVFTLELKTLAWSPRQCRQVLSVDWDQREWNQRPLEAGETAGVPRRGDAVATGRYELNAGWGNVGSERAAFEIAE
jgi:hypothetical protein